jgi:uncharacterized protein YggE
MGRITFLLAAAGTVVLAGALLLLSNWVQPPSTRSTVFASSSGQTQAAPIVPDGSGQSSGIVVTGEGSVTVKPDLAKVTLGVEVTNSSANGAQRDAASKMDAVMSQLKSQGIEDKDIQTVRFDLQPNYDYSTQPPVLKGYRATNLVVVTVRDVSKVGGLLDAVVSSGATRLQGISFSVSDPTAAGAQGREEAMKDARAKADQLAQLAGVSVGQPISIEETTSAPPTPVEIRPAAAPSLAAAPQTPISPGTQEIHTTVRVVYSIK